ncbi:GyrI-like domain-containing protein [Granulosicoccus sp.]|nr:GyrI-like domain-containing protein [Granulosicoccus sp.]MDB4223691.1 GyrI-like domain-containing protein [Granulosicoccus sp.]
MPKFNVESSIDIAVPAEIILDVLVDFNTWPIWSPWLYMEPKTQVSYRGEPGQTGHGYDWQGNKTGSGGMTLLSSSSNRVDCDLQFLKPFKSEAEVAFDIQPLEDGQARVTWSMLSSLPIFMFWMKPMMIGMIKSDYNRGLLLLKDYVETGSIPSSTTVDGIVDVQQIYYVGTRAEAQLSDMADSIASSFQSLADASVSEQFSISGSPFCIYSSMDMKTQRCGYIAAVPTYDPTPLEAPYVSAIRPACSALKVIHAGPYRHLGNAWSLIMAEAKERKLKIQKSQPPFEKYLNNPAEVDENDLITEIYLPIKA